MTHKGSRVLSRPTTGETARWPRRKPYPVFRRAPSPRARGEGWDEGASPLSSDLGAQNRGEAPSPSSLRSSTSPHAGRGEQAHSFSRCTRIRALPRHCKKAISNSSPKRREAGRRQAHRPGRIFRCGAHLGSVRPACAEKTGAQWTPWTLLERARSPFGAPPRLPRLSSARPKPALPGTTGCKREDPLRHQCSEHLAVRHWAGRADAKAARRGS